MKIGFDAKRYYHNNTGLGNYSRTIVGKLQQMFPDCECVLYDEKSLTRTLNLGMKAAADGCDIFHGLSNELPFDLHHRESLSENRGRKLKMPASIVTIHDVCWRTYTEMYHFFDRKIYDIKYGSSCRRADKVIAISESTKRDVMQIYGVPEERIEVIYQPVQEYYYTPLDHEVAKRLISDALPTLPNDFILYVGSINKRKNLLNVVEALSLIPAERRPYLLIVGNGREYRREVEAFIAKHHLEGFTGIETGIHNNQLLQALYSCAKAFVYPSFYEGFGLPVVEAALQHTPVITSTVSSLPEAAGPDACLIDPHAKDAAEQTANYISRLCCDTEYADTIATGMEAYARREFTPETLINKVMKLYESLV